jgi:RiboL-PSP-HEPN
MTVVTDIERLHLEIIEIRERLSGSSDMSVVANFESLSAKGLLLAAASHFERRVTDLLIETAKSLGNNEVIAEFIKNQALSRKYHTMFDWDSANLNKFFGLFGTSAKNQLTKETSDLPLKDCVAAFIFINSERNRLVHRDYASFTLNTTTDEVWERFQKASHFCEWLGERLKLFIQK